MTTPQKTLIFEEAEVHVEELDYIDNEHRNIAGNSYMAGMRRGIELSAQIFEGERCIDHENERCVASRILDLLDAPAGGEGE